MDVDFIIPMWLLWVIGVPVGFAVLLFAGSGLCFFIQFYRMRW